MTKEFPSELRGVIAGLDGQRECPLDQRLKDAYVHYFAKLCEDDVPERYRPEYRVLKNRLEDFCGSGSKEGEESARQIERQLRGLLEAATAILK